MVYGVEVYALLGVTPSSYGWLVDTHSTILDWAGFPERIRTTKALRNPCAPSHAFASSASNTLVYTLLTPTPHTPYFQLLGRYDIAHRRTLMSVTLFFLCALLSMFLLSLPDDAGQPRLFLEF